MTKIEPAVEPTVDNDDNSVAPDSLSNIERDCDAAMAANHRSVVRTFVVGLLFGPAVGLAAYLILRAL